MRVFPCLLLAVLAFTARSVDSARILGFFSTSSPSHLIIQMSVIQTMIDRGHYVTVVTVLPLSRKTNSTFRHIQLDGIKLPENIFKNAMENTHNPWKLIPNLKKMIDFGIYQSTVTLNDTKIQKLMQEESFDLVLWGFFLNHFQMGVATHFKCPLVVIDTHKLTMQMNGFLGNPLELFYVPGLMLPFDQPLSFTGRLLNVVLAGVEYLMGLYYTPIMKEIYSGFFPPDKYPSFEETTKNIALVLHTSHFSEGLIRPNVPAFIQIGGIQAKSDPDPLPQEIKAFLDNAKDGAILLSFGSNVRPGDLNSEAVGVIYKILSGLKQKVIWKWDSDRLPGDSPNILYEKWLPQDDILAHRNIKLFITHCGLGSIVESQYHGVPMVGVPLFGDQFGLAASMAAAGYGVHVGYTDLTEDSFRNAVQEVLGNRTYGEAVKRFSERYRDRPMNARDTAAYWIEYVIRHKGAKHMQSPAVHMSLVEYFGLDVMAALALAGYLVYKILVIVFRSAFCMIRRKFRKAKRD